MSRVLLALLTLTPLHAYFLPLAQDQSEPALRLWDGRLVRWDTGPVPALLETSSAVRISYRGIHFYDHDVFPRSRPFACPRTPGAFCRLAHDGNLIMPFIDLPRYSTGSAQAAPVRYASRDGCGQESAGRLVVDNPAVYDISSCDLANIDLVWSKGFVYVDTETRLPLWAYVASSLCVLFLVISLGQNIGSILGDPEAETQPWFTEVVCFAQSALILVLNDPMHIWVAEHDRLMLFITVAYILLYLSRHGVSLLVMDRNVYTLNVITATLMLVTSRLYCSFETPYATIFLLLLLSRLAHKLLSMPEIVGIERLLIYADALLAGLHYRLAYHPSFFDPQVTLLAMRFNLKVTCFTPCAGVRRVPIDHCVGRACGRSRDLRRQGKVQSTSTGPECGRTPRRPSRRQRYSHGHISGKLP